MKNKVLFLLFLALTGLNVMAQQQYTVQSPNGRITVTVNTGERLSYAVMHGKTVVLDESPIAMTLDNGKVLGVPANASNAQIQSVHQTIEAPFYKRNKIKDDFNELIISFKGNYKVIFRAYDEGVAYRFDCGITKPYHVVSETADFNFDQDYTAWVPYVNARKGEGDFIQQQFFTSFENTYTITSLSKMEPERLVFLPALVDLKNGKKVVITEADLEDFPGLLLRNEKGKTGFTAIHAGYPKVEEQGGHGGVRTRFHLQDHYRRHGYGRESGHRFHILQCF